MLRMKHFLARHNIRLYDVVMLLLITAVQIAVILHYTFERRNLYVDEIWTFNTANHYYFPFLFQSAESYLNRWLPASFWSHSLVADPNHTFSFGSVFYNMSQDSHPPFYFIIIHSVCSLFPGEFSRWFGIIPNLVFFILFQLLFYVTGLKLFGKKPAALGLCLLYGCCWGTVNNVMLIRMYMMVTLFALLSYYIHLTMIGQAEEQRVSKKTLFLTYFFSVFGFLTHYYFLIYAFYLFIGTVILLFFYQRTYIIKHYFLTLIGALLSCLLINPCIPAQFIGRVGEHGSKTWHNLIHSDIMHRAAVMSGFVSQDLLGHNACLFILLLLLLFFVRVLSDVRNKRPPVTPDTATPAWDKENSFVSSFERFSIFRCGLFLAAFTSAAYFLTASKILLFFQHRYMYIIHPFVIICLFSIVYSLLQKLKFTEGMSLAITVLVILGLNVSHYNRKNLQLLDDSYTGMLTSVKRNYSDVDMITVCNSNNWFPVINHLMLFREVPNTLMIKERRLLGLKRIVKAMPSNSGKFLIYRGYNCKAKPEEFLKTVKKLSGFKHHRMLFKNWTGEIYLISGK